MAEPITKNDAVRNLQRYLRRLSFEENDIQAVPIDGIFASRTEEALSEFQRMNRLPVTGRADKITWDLLFEEYQRLDRKTDHREILDLFPKAPPRYQTTLGEQSSFIGLVQWMLLELSAFYDTLSPSVVTGQMDIATSDSVSEFQRIHRIPQTGQVDRNTWNHISKAYSQYTV